MYLFLLGGGLIAAGEQLNLLWMTRIALLMIGLMAVAGGIRTIIRGKIYLGRRKIVNPAYVERYASLSARLMGLVLLITGIAIILFSLIDLVRPGGATVFLSGLTSSSYGLALLLGSAGLIVVAFGVVRLLSGSGTYRGTHAGYIEFLIKAGGVVAIMIGSIMVMLSLLTIVRPTVLQELQASVVRMASVLVLGK